MSEDMMTLQIEAMKARKNLCESIGDRGCGGCPLDELRREKNMDCEKACCYFPTVVIEAAIQYKNAKAKATSSEKTKSIRTDWEAAAKQLQKANEQLQIDLNAERKHSAQLEKDLREARDSIGQKEKLLERVKGQRDAYREPLEWILHDQHDEGRG